MALLGMDLWDAELLGYLVVEDEGEFLADVSRGVELLLYLPHLPFLADFEVGKSCKCWINLKRSYGGIRRLPWKSLKGLPGAALAMKKNQFFISEKGVLTMLRQSRQAKKFVEARDLTVEDAVEQFQQACLSLREKFQQTPAAWSRPDPRRAVPQAPGEDDVPGVALPPLPIPAEEDDPPVAPALPDDGAEVDDADVPLARRPKGRPKHTPAEAKAANDRRTDVTSAKKQIAIASRLLAQHNQVHGGCSLHEALRLVGQKSKAAGPNQTLLTKKQKIAVFTECVESVFPSLWAVLLGIDMAFMSFQAAATLRSFVGARFIQPPREWVSDFSRLLSSECEREFDVQPRGDEPHPTLTDTPDGRGKPLTSTSAISTSLERLLHWHIAGAIAGGHDLRPYLMNSAEQRVLQYKITFDTTQTFNQDLFMMGVIPHSFPNSARHRISSVLPAPAAANPEAPPAPGGKRKKRANGNVQSANNVLILCLARIGESNHVIQNAVPGLRQTIQRLSALGTSVVLAGGVELKFRVEFHIAADLKALWLCLGLKNFVCPFCTQTSFNEDLHGTFDARELSGCLGVPSNRVHLCSLHATLRIVERLVKNAASFVYQHHEVRVRNQKFKALSGLIESKLKRKKFNITVGSLKEAKVEEALPADEVFIDNDASLGTNLGAMFQNNVHVKLSALTGSQAIKILEKEDIYMGIIDITEGEPLLTPTDSQSNPQNHAHAPLCGELRWLPASFWHKQRDKSVGAAW